MVFGIALLQTDIVRNVAHRPGFIFGEQTSTFTMTFKKLIWMILEISSIHHDMA